MAELVGGHCCYGRPTPDPASLAKGFNRIFCKKLCDWQTEKIQHRIEGSIVVLQKLILGISKLRSSSMTYYIDLYRHFITTYRDKNCLGGVVPGRPSM